MGSVRRRGSVGATRGLAGATLALALFTAGCSGIAKEPSIELRVGYDTLDGTLEVWPARGDLAGDRNTVDAVTDAVRRWRSPIDDEVHLNSSGILWLGTVDGAPLALVAADVPGQAASWLLQVTGQGTDFTVSRASEYTDPGYLVYSDVLPVQLAGGRRYLTSTRVEQLLGPTGQPVAVADGLSAPVAVPACTAVTITSRLRASESLPQGKAADTLLDLGTGTRDPRYPLVGDEAGTGAKALAGLDTCALAEETGPFGSVPRRNGERIDLDSVPASWPIEQVSTRPLGEVPLRGRGPAKLEQLSWRTATGTTTAVVVRPSGGAAVASKADQFSPLQAYEVAPSPDQPLVVLLWTPDPQSSLSTQTETSRLVDQPGLVVVDQPVKPEIFRLAMIDKTIERAVG